LNNETENTTPSLYTEDGTVDFRGNPAVRATTGGKKTTAILLGKSFLNFRHSLFVAERLQYDNPCYPFATSIFLKIYHSLRSM
jgi:hypothetical protein